MTDDKQTIEIRLRTIIRNNFEDSTKRSINDYASARSKSPNSGAWIKVAVRSFEERFTSAIKDALQTMAAEIDPILREDPQAFWDFARQYLKESLFRSAPSFQATVVSQNKVAPERAIQRAIGQATRNLEAAIDREVGNFIQRDRISHLASTVAESKRPAQKDSPMQQNAPTTKAGLSTYVHKDRIQEITKLKDFDPTKLVRMLEEMNDAYRSEAYFSIILLLRAILDHVPPIFGKSTFKDLANTYGGTKSFKDSMLHLENSSRKIADAHLHTPIRSKESLPNSNQVDFSPDLDVLLAEIIRIRC